MGAINHATVYGYNRGCRCEPCREAKRLANIRSNERRQHRKYTQRHPTAWVDREALGDLLQELFPLGLTDECPARRSKVAA